MNEFTHPPPSEHEVYLLRVWHEPDGNDLVWRASMLLPQNTGRRYFATPDALLDFLGERVREEKRP
ncbi:hypothetical protein DAETH_44340 (plasmid) [Deinococcus aetherius]|uniref:Uncharacterized protein n=1 Tax=Deinococcus aetherius TaxID=200252 RepID=A0ABN6RMB1_9DEIO|nr:hypothetical protein [Deinococcus aetherius]BDP44465.1 hypothetical protein DAETH_44340 [Deinococcus aetherius]